MRRRYERLVASIAGQPPFQARPSRADFLQRRLTSIRAGRHFPASTRAELTSTRTLTDLSPPELSARQYALMLLNVAAQIEHALMVQYLFAAYSLGGPQIASSEYRALANEWRTTLLGIAKEEMGHLLTVQNIIRFLGAVPSLERDDYPVHSPFHAFEFQLEPLTSASLARYIVAESPEKGVGQEIINLAKKGNRGEPVNRVGNLYAVLKALFLSKQARGFEPGEPRSSARYQATWDEWGRGYRDGQRGKPANLVHKHAQSDKSPEDGPDLLIVPIDSVDQVVIAIDTIAEQGESPEDISSGKSHFTRLSHIFDQFPKHGEWQPSRRTALNPSTNQWTPAETDVSVATSPADAASSATAAAINRGEPPVSFISNRISRTWGHLFNVRYRMALFGIAHALQLPTPEQDRARGQVIARVFGEMYTMRAIADVLVDLPLGDDDGADRAGPPFEMPYTLTIPDTEPARWRTYQDFIDASAELIGTLVKDGTPHDEYLSALRLGDAGYLQIVRGFMAAREPKSSTSRR